MNLNQKPYWEQWNKEYRDSEQASESVKEFSKHLKPNSKILELGCGPGEDAAYLAKQHSVIAIDYTKSAIQQNQEKFRGIKNLQFIQHDSSKPLPFKDETFDGIYARLSLHYFTDEVTRAIFAEVHRVLKPKGLFYFVCKSSSDKLFGKGRVIDNDTFVDDNGHLRHFFAIDFAKQNLNSLFKPKILELRDIFVYGSESNVLVCLAEKG